MKMNIESQSKCEGFKIIKLGYIEPKVEERMFCDHKRDYICPICLEIGEICEKCRDKYL